jgi:hypothetical protein
MALLKRSDYDKFSTAWGEFLTRGGRLSSNPPLKLGVSTKFQARGRINA